ncbi:MAG TPA: HPF/RaiA family ribosome-associated protein [Candidatus Andersenbacteria bacterium]|nr:MAG: hypothetical protein A2854_01625 [Parcubacteria group bacterium RIFCSPHIGHO2_01_FULL_56_18]HLD26159.1 HPF/RaiA family ribosome-associated protein [Candidatus Andersenbacteria bacterium]
MKHSLTCQNIELSAADYELLEEKLQRLQKHVQIPFHTRVVLRADAHHRSGQIITCTLTISQGGAIFHAERGGDTVQTAVDKTVAALKAELGKERDKQRRKH